MTRGCPRPKYAGAIIMGGIIMGGTAVGTATMVGIEDGVTIIVIGDGRSVSLEPEQARLAGLFFVRVAAVRC